MKDTKKKATANKATDTWTHFTSYKKLVEVHPEIAKVKNAFTFDVLTTEDEVVTHVAITYFYSKGYEYKYACYSVTPQGELVELGYTESIKTAKQLATATRAFTELISYSTLTHSDVETLQLVLEDMLENGVGMRYE